MKQILTLSALAIGLCASPAMAQDEEDWTGPYIGVQGGYTGAKSDTSVVLGGAWASESQALRDFFGSSMGTKQSDGDVNFGAQLGYNVQTSGIVLGLEGEFSVLNGGETIARGPLAVPSIPALSYSYTNTVDPKHMFALKAKLGGAMGRTLFYVNGGWAWTKATLGTSVTSNGNYLKTGSLDTTMDGFIVGGGVEHRLSDNLSLRLTYDYTDQGDETYVTTYRAGSSFTAPAYTETVTQDLRLHLVRVGVNYRF